MEKLRAGIIGTGGIAGAHMTNLKNMLSAFYRKAAWF